VAGLAQSADALFAVSTDSKKVVKIDKKTVDLSDRAVSLILCHNHPSGSLKPSRADEELTAKIAGAAKFFDIRVVDHIIVSESGYYSFADEGAL